MHLSIQQTAAAAGGNMESNARQPQPATAAVGGTMESGTRQSRPGKTEILQRFFSA